ncbi:DNA polymerase III subunit alpha [Mycoplasmatota bacterium]|nr:DNA polymerase III subunit alpha [Mycoplasmatota bacterium]
MYTQLYSKTVYSLLKSCLKIEAYVEKAKQQNMQALAITDENNVYGLIKFYKACQKQGIKPILGTTVFLQSNTPLILLAKNNNGYKNLLSIITEVQLNNSLISLEKLDLYHLDIICIIPTQNNTFSRFIKPLKEIFENDVFLSLFPEINETIKEINQKVIEIGNQLNVENVSLNEVKYCHPEDALTLRYLEAIDKGYNLSKNTIDLFSSNQYFLEVKKYQAYFKNYQKAIDNTNLIADRCHVKLDFDSFHMPKYKTPNEVSSNEYLKALCKIGLEKRLNTKEFPSVYYERLKYELTIIKKMNFSDYFLIVYDFVKYAKKNQIYVGPGRGSSAGSLVSFVLGITNVDPITHQLLFERFLNPERVTMPDIDLDFQDDRRDEVIKYVQNKYGKHHVAHIISFGTFAARSAIREVAKVMGIKDSRINEIISYIDSKLTIDQNINNNEEFKKLINEYKEIAKLIDIAKKIESIPRNTTTHAAGIIICEEDLRQLTGLQPSLDEVLQTQFEAKDLESLGLLKMDFLGIRNLTAINEILELIEKTHHIKIDINHIPFDDPKTYRLIARGETTGLFQLESSGMRSVLRDIKASQFEDIVAVNALFRPGPMDNIPLYIARKNKKQKVEYLHEDLIPILESTYGIIVYQEQIMKIAQKIAGYSLASADLLRRAISKKQKDVLQKERVKFVDSAMKNGYNQLTSETLYDYIVKFGDYGFNRSHSVAYALISYQMAYLKANYLIPFMVVMLSSILGSETQTGRYIRDCKRYGIKILPISINNSYNNYSIENNNSIRMAFLIIKGIGQNSGEAIINEREKGIFKNYIDFVFRCHVFLKQNIFEALVYSGALDEFKLSKKAMINNYRKIIDLCRFNQSGYFTDKIEINTDLDEYPINQLMKKEKEYLGFYLSTHPIRKYIEKDNQSSIIPSKTLKYLNKSIELVGFVENIRKTITKNNEEMATLIISDDITSVNGVVFPKIYQLIKDKLIKDQLVKIRCKVQERNQKIQLVIFDIEIINNET